MIATLTDAQLLIHFVVLSDTFIFIFMLLRNHAK